MSKIKLNMLKLKLSPRKEITRLILICGVILLVFVGLSIFLNDWKYSLISLGIDALFTVVYLLRYGSKVAQLDKQNIQEFVNLFTFFKIYVRNGANVYTALKEITVFANASLKELFDILLVEIDNDKTVEPFIHFARNFNDIIVEEMMISIYQMVDDGEQSDYLTQFEMIFDKFSELMYQKELRNKDSGLGRLSAAPLIGSCFLVILITIGIVNILGDLTNVL